MLKKIILIICLVVALPALAQQKPSLVELQWEAATYAPPFYQGHSLPSSQSLVKVVALPEIYDGHGALIKIADLTFDWIKDGRNIASESGPGKNTLTIVADTAGGQNTVEVTVFIPQTTIRVQKQIIINVTKPQLLIYEDDPLLGVRYERAIADTFNLVSPEINLVAEPFYFTGADVMGNKLAIDWQLNGKSIVSDAQKPRLITLATPAGGSGSNEVKVSAKNNANILQTAENLFKIVFGQSNINF